jgi:nucleoid DNA-binding protein
MVTHTVTFRRDIAQSIRERHDVTLAEARAILDTVLEHITYALHMGDPVRLGKIGVLMPSLVQARKRYNQVTQKVETRKEHRTLKLRLTATYKAQYRVGKKVAGKLRPAPRSGYEVSKDCAARNQESKRTRGK